MNGYTHIASGLAFSYLTGASGPETIVCVLGTIMPDIDSSSSILGRFIPKPIHKLMFKKGYNHRGFLHTMIMPILLAFTPYRYLLYGYLLHLLYDSFNYSGIRILPKTKRISFGNVKEGSFTEKLIFLLTATVPILLYMEVM